MRKLAPALSPEQALFWFKCGLWRGTRRPMAAAAPAPVRPRFAKGEPTVRRFGALSILWRQLNGEGRGRDKARRSGVGCAVPRTGAGAGDGVGVMGASTHPTLAFMRASYKVATSTVRTAAAE